jgi:hypothetical protein
VIDLSFSSIDHRRSTAQKELPMAKGQRRSNREAKKPKQVKLAVAPVGGEGLLARSNLAGSTANRKRP